ncbi:MAG: glycine zipper family protein [Flavobacteriales bacterium]|jgi:hypothetical protein|tara:strand:+ start:415 stop:1320 length:906 start_codon:yes stop_codon:yes gene_type:complete
MKNNILKLSISIAILGISLWACKKEEVTKHTPTNLIPRSELTSLRMTDQIGYAHNKACEFIIENFNTNTIISRENNNDIELFLRNEMTSNLTNSIENTVLENQNYTNNLIINDLNNAMEIISFNQNTNVLKQNLTNKLNNSFDKLSDYIITTHEQNFISELESIFANTSNNTTIESLKNQIQALKSQWISKYPSDNDLSLNDGVISGLSIAIAENSLNLWSEELTDHDLDEDYIGTVANIVVGDIIGAVEGIYGSIIGGLATGNLDNVNWTNAAIGAGMGAISASASGGMGLVCKLLKLWW